MVYASRPSSPIAPRCGSPSTGPRSVAQPAPMSTDAVRSGVGSRWLVDRSTQTHAASPYSTRTTTPWRWRPCGRPAPGGRDCWNQWASTMVTYVSAGFTPSGGVTDLRRGPRWRSGDQARHEGLEIRGEERDPVVRGYYPRSPFLGQFASATRWAQKNRQLSRPQTGAATIQNHPSTRLDDRAQQRGTGGRGGGRLAAPRVVGASVGAEGVEAAREVSRGTDARRWGYGQRDGRLGSSPGLLSLEWRYGLVRRSALRGSTA